MTNIKSLTDNYQIIYLDEATTTIYGIIKASLRKKGKPIPENDIWIAAAAAQHGLPILTTDNHFKEIAEIDLA